MPQYDITVEGEKPLRVEMDSPPSDDEVQEIYDRYIKSPLREGWFVGNDSKPHQTASSVDTHPEVETFGKQAKQAWEDVNKPLVTLGKDTTEQETAGMGKFGKSAIGTGEAAKHFTESLTSPLSLATVGLGGVLAKSYPWISRALSGAFGATMAKQTAEEAGELAGTPKNQRDAKTVAKHIASIALSGGTTMLAAYDAGLSKHPEVQANTKPTAATSKPSIPQQIINESKGTLPLAASVAEKIEKSETSKNEPLPKPIEQPAEAPIVPPVEQPVKQPVANPVNPAPVETPVKPPEQPAANPPVLQTSAKNVTAPKPAPLVEVKPSPAPAPPSAQATEANPAPGDYVSNMFAAIDRDRAAMGKPPMEDTKRRTWDEDNQKALATMNRDPNWIPRLIDEVRDSPRALQSWEQAGMVWHRNRLMSEMHNAMSKINQAFEDGRAADLEEAKIDSARYEDELYDLDGVVGRNGTGSEAGRSLQAQKMAAGEDFSLVQMVLEKRAAKGGAKLTDAERAEIEKLHSDIETWQKKYDEHVAKSNEKEADIKLQLTTERLKKEATPIPPQFQRIIDRIGKTLDEQADAALLRIKARSGRLSAGLDPTVLADVSLVGARYIFKGMKKGVEWSSKLIEAIGEEYRPFLDQIWDAANKKYDGITDRTAGEKVKEVRRRIKDMSSPERIEYTTGKIADRIKRGKKDEISSLVQRLARSFVEQYPNINRDGLVDFVHNTLKKIDQKITRSQARDMISGYGDYKQLSQDKISVKLRDLKGQLQQIAKLESMQEGEPPLKTGIGRRTPSIEESKLIKQVNDAKREFQIPIDNPDTQLKSSLDTLKARLTSSIRDYEDRLANRDFDPAPKREIKMDNEALRLKAEAERAKSKFLSWLRADKMKNRKFNEKALDAMVKWSRGFLLSGPSTLGKLTSAAFLRLGLNPMEETVGSVLKHLPYVKQVAARAPIEGHGINARIEANALTAGLMQGLKDADQTLRTGKSSLDRVFGKRQDSGIGELDDEQKSVVDIFGHIHGALKAPVKRVAFERALLNQAEFYIGKGVDVSDPGVQTKMMVEAWKREAYKRANKDIFMQPNHYADRFRRAINSLEEKAKGEKNVKPTRKLAASMLRTLVPIMKVPTNIVGEAIEYATGLVTGSAKTAQAFHAGIDQLKPEQADQIMRELKKGTIGTAALLLGYYLPQYVGGFYQQGEKRPKGDVKYGGVRMFGHDIPKTILHHPLIEAAQMGATIARVADSKLRKKDLEKQGLPEGAFAGLLGLIDDVPFIEDTFEASKLMNPHDRGMYLGELAKSRIVPQMLSQAAEYYDKDAQGNPIKRKPDKTGLKAAGQYLEMGVPGLRETVPPRKRQ
jgi:hypothetical protein